MCVGWGGGGYDIILYGMVWYGMEGYGIVWKEMGGVGMVWCWYGMQF